MMTKNRHEKRPTAAKLEPFSVDADDDAISLRNDIVAQKRPDAALYLRIRCVFDILAPVRGLSPCRV